MPNPLNPGVQKTSQKSTFGLVVDLAARVLKTQIETSRDNAVANPSIERVASTQALKEVDDRIPNLVDLIDDTATDNQSAWSASKVISYIAEKDDSEYFVDKAGLDAFTLTPERDGFVAIVYNASDDPAVGTDDNGDPLGGIYVREASAWKLLKTIGYRAVSFVGYLHENDLINDFVTDDPTKPVSASVAVALKGLIDEASTSATNIALLPQLLPLNWDAVASVNTATPQFKPMGEIVDFKATVIDANGVQTPYAAEVFDDNGTSKIRIIMETPTDLSSDKVLFTYLHAQVAN